MPNARPPFLTIAAAAIAGTALLLVVAGPLLANLGAIAPLRAFGLFALGSLLGLVGLVLGGIGLLVTRGGVAGRERAWFAVAIGALLVLALVVSALPGRDLPRINDITTDPSDPPSFEAAAGDAPNVGRDMGYDPTFAAIQREGYPDLAPVRLPVPPAAAHERALAAVDELGWERVASDPSEGRIEAREASRLFRFVDDIVIRVRAADGGSVVDVRSKSRDGRGDLGANAARIRAFVDALAADPPGR